MYYTLEQVDATLGGMLDKARERLAAGGWQQVNFVVRLTPAAHEDLRRLYEHLLDRANTIEDFEQAELARAPRSASAGKPWHSVLYFENLNGP